MATNGANGYGLIFACNGDLSFKGNVQIESQSGGDGGNGLGAFTTVGGSGGNGGILVIRAFGDMNFTDEGPGLIPNQFFSGSGGAGGEGLPDSPAQDPLVDPAPGNSGTAGTGGDGGSLRMEVLNELNIAPNSFFAQAGSGGFGGNAFASGADGVHGADRAGPPQMGGSGTAVAGNGGGAIGFSFVVVSGVINGDENLVFGDMSNAGDGGMADASGGNGGNGESDGDPENNALKHGEKGGPVTAMGGNGGVAGFLGFAGTGRAGNGGNATFRRSRGGDGWVDCRLPLDLSGGNGGMGGVVAGGHGSKGSGGLGPGVDGNVFTQDVSNGGDGGDGNGVGAAGMGGDPTPIGGGATPNSGRTPSRTHGLRTEIGTESFKDGQEGNPCKTGLYEIFFSLLEDLDNHAQFLGLPT